MIKKFLLIILVLCIIFMVGSVVFAGGPGSGSLDNYKGHFYQENGKATAYHYHDGINKGYEIVFYNPVKWDKRCTIKLPLKPNDNTLGIWKQYINCNFPLIHTIPTPPTEKPSESISPEPSVTSEVSTSPENTPGQETAQASVNPTSTNTGSTLPKTGESSSVLIYVGIAIVLAGLIISIVFRKKLFN